MTVSCRQFFSLYCFAVVTGLSLCVSSARIFGSTGFQASPEDLLSRYIEVATHHPRASTREAAKFWQAEAEREGLVSSSFSIDPDGHCVHWIAYLPATIASPLDPILLLHHGDVVSANESEWRSSPYRAVIDANMRLTGRGAIDDKGPGVVHWFALKQLKALSGLKRLRDVYFVMNCGEEVADPFGAAAFVNFLVRPLPDSYFFKSSGGYELSSVDKLEIGSILQKFPSLPKVGFVWNEGSFASVTEVAPKILAPIANSQKGRWLGEIFVRGVGGHGSLASHVTPIETLSRGTTELYDQNRSYKHWLRSLHAEHVEMVKVISAVRPWWQSWALRIFPRAFFAFAHLESLVASWWQVGVPKTNSDMPNVIATEVSAMLEYRFVGEKSQVEIEYEVEKIFKTFSGTRNQIELRTHNFSPFRRSFFEGNEADAFREVLMSQPNVLVTPFITPGITDSRFFRMVGVKAFDFVPFFLDRDEIYAMHGSNESLRIEDLHRAINIETEILRRIVSK